MNKPATLRPSSSRGKIPLLILGLTFSATSFSAERIQFVLTSMDSTPRAGAFEENTYKKFYDSVHDAGNALFTLFINTGYMQLDPRRATTVPPEERALLGKRPLNAPPIPYASDAAQARSRAENIRRLSDLGVEIGSHTVRHLHGHAWTVAQWEEEFADHQRVLDFFMLPRPRGIRAPFLETNPGFFRALQTHQMAFDTSVVGGPRRAWPRRLSHGAGPWEVTIPSAELPNGKGRALFFDLNLKNNFHVTDDEYVTAALGEFQARYQGSRAPFLMCGHGNYLGAIARVMRSVCGLPSVRCGTFSELVEYMKQHPELEGR